jgi:O-antigen/teichoic acid export membrane protein
MPVKSLDANAPRQTSGTSAITFTICRYVTYAFAFLRSLLVAKYLGPHLLGVFGFLLLVTQYLSYSGLGLQFALNVELATTPVPTHCRSSSVALTLTGVIAAGLIVIGLVIQSTHFRLFAKYSFSQYALAIGLIAALSLVQQVYTNIYRIYGKLIEIAGVEIVSALLLLLLTFVFRGQALITALLCGLVASTAFAVMVFVLRAPFAFCFSLDRAYARPLLRLGIPLLIYNASFYLITMVAQTVVSIFYSLETMGYYTLASSIANVALLGFNSIAWIAYPIVLGKTHQDAPDEDAGRVTDRVNVVLGTGVFLMVFAVVLGLPILFLVLPHYAHARGVVTVLLLSQALLMSSFGYNCLAIARRKQMAIANVSMLSVLVVTVLAIMAGIIHVDFIWVAIAVLAGSALFSLFQARIGSELLGGIKLRQIVPVGSIASVAVCLAGTLAGYPFTGAVLGSTVYLATNKNKILEVWNVCSPYIISSSKRTTSEL